MATKLNDLRKDAGMTAKELAKELNISMSLMIKLLYTDLKPSANVLQKVKNRFPDIDMNMFFGKDKP